MKSKSILRFSTIAIAIAYVGSAHAADVTFSTTQTYTDTQNYDNGVVGPNQFTVVTFDSGADYTFTGNVTTSNAWNRIHLNSGAALDISGSLTVNLSGVSLNGGTLTTGGLYLHDSPNWGGTLNDGKQVIEYGDSVINGSTIIANQSNASFISKAPTPVFPEAIGNGLWLNADGAAINSNGFDIGISMNMVGGGGLTKTGNGTLTLSASNSYTGNTTINGGTLKIAEGASIYNGGYNNTSVVTVNTGATLELNRWGYGPGAANQSLGGLDYNPARFVINGGTVKYTGGAAGAPTDPGEAPYGPGFTIGALGATLDAATAGDTWTVKYDSRGFGPIASNDGGTLTLTGIGNGVFDKELGGAGGVVMNGSGTWTLNRTNTYSGPTTVSSGTLSLTNPSLDNASSVVIGTTPGATMNLNFTGHDIVGSLAINGSGPLPAGSYNSSHPTYGSYFTGSGSLVVAPAGNGTWTSLANGDWENPANWLANTIAIGADNTATFNASSGATVTLTSGQTIGNLAFAVSDYTLAGAALTLDSSGTPAINVATDRTATITTTLAGIAGMEKTGDGTLVLTAANNYGGGTTVNAGTLILDGATGGTSRIIGALTVNSGATVSLTNGDTTGLGYNGGAKVTSLTINGGTVTTAGVTHIWNYSGGVDMTGGTLQSNNGVSDPNGPQMEWINADVTTNTSANTATIGGRINMRADGGVTGINFTVADGTAATDLLVSAAVTQASAGLGITKNDSGTMVLSGANTYTGNTVVNAGSLQLTSTSQMQFVVNETPASNQITGAGTATFDGVFNINTAAVTGTTGYIWLLVDRASLSGESFGSNFSVAGFSPELDGVTWTMSDSRGTWSFSEDSGELTLDIGNDYDTWKSANGVTGGENDDDDSDGLTNHEEYAFGTDPTGGSEVNPIISQLNKTTGKFSYTRRKIDLPDPALDYSVWFSTDLSTWTEDTGATEGTPVLNGEVETVEVTLSALPGNPLPAKLFIQVRAQ